MYAIRRRTIGSISQLSTASQIVGRRYASGHEHHEGPKNESLGTQFYLVLAAISIAIAVHTAAQKTPDGKVAGLSALIDKYSDYKEKWAARNTLHTAMIEKAAFDRNLYQSSSGTKHVDLKYPEIFNTGSPYNVSAGQSARNLNELVTYYEKKNAETEARKIQSVEEKES